jgi:hypothetical protein
MRCSVQNPSSAFEKSAGRGRRSFAGNGSTKRFSGSVQKETRTAQINFHTTPEFDADLAAMMSALRLKSKSQAILAVQDVATVLRERAAREKGDISPRLRGE